jgi:crotonobetainyl-CoA:carnitine CoA-transferase CaiB-like acyl-CoA transferase
MTAKDMAEDPHYKARNLHVEWEDGQAGKVKGTGITPKFSVTPGKIWRGSVPVGHDNDRIYKELAGLTDQDLARLKKEGVI